MKCEVLRYFHLKDTDKHYAPGDIIEVTDDQFARIMSLGNVVKVLEVAEPVAEKPKKTRKTKQ